MMQRMVGAAVAENPPTLCGAFVEIGFLSVSDAPTPVELMS